MIALLPAEIKRQLGRRPSFLGSTIVNLLFGLGILAWVIFSEAPTTSEALEGGAGLLTFSGILTSIVLGAIAGAYDVDQGVMRYLVLTGRPRWQLVVVRIPALAVTVVLTLLPAIAVVLVAALIAPDAGEGFSGERLMDLFYGVPVAGFLYGFLSLTIGTFLKSSSVAIAVSVVFNFAAFAIIAVIWEYVSETLAKGFYQVVAGVAIDREAGTGDEGTFGVPLSLAILAVWLVVLLGAALLRVQRSEY